MLSRRQFVIAGAAIASIGLLPVAACGSVGTPNLATPVWVRVATGTLETGRPVWLEFDVPSASAPSAASSGQVAAPTAAPMSLNADATPDVTLRASRGAAWLVRETDGTVVAFDPHCTHARCLYDWDSSADRFACRCHAGFFAVDGTVLGGPPPRPLDRLATRPSGQGAIEIAWRG